MMLPLLLPPPLLPPRLLPPQRRPLLLQLLSMHAHGLGEDFEFSSCIIP